MSAVPGTFDTTFGGTGTVNTEIGSGAGTAVAIAELPDGNIVAGGSQQSSTSNIRLALANYNTNGALDTSFGTKGTVLTAITTTTSTKKAEVYYVTGDYTSAVLPLPDGNIIDVGLSIVATSTNKGVESDTQYLTMVEYNANGSVDSSFGTSGISQTLIFSDPTAWDGFLNISAALQSNGNIVVAIGLKATVGANVSELADFSANGSLNTSFGDQGTGFVQLNWARNPIIAVEPDNSILVDATMPTGNYLAHYSALGVLDTQFGSPGVAGTGLVSVTSSSMALESVNSVDDTIVMGGGGQLYRYNLNGTVDTTFGTNGVATLPSGYTVTSVLAEPQVGGDIIVLAQNAPIAFTANGTIDTSFGTAGIGPVWPDSEFATAIENVAGEPGYGDILVAGRGNSGFAVGRYVGPTTITPAASPAASSATTDMAAAALLARPDSDTLLVGAPTVSANQLSRDGVDRFFVDFKIDMIQS